MQKKMRLMFRCPQCGGDKFLQAVIEIDGKPQLSHVRDCQTQGCGYSSGNLFDHTVAVEETTFDTEDEYKQFLFDRISI